MQHVPQLVTRQRQHELLDSVGLVRGGGGDAGEVMVMEVVVVVVVVMQMR